jgi:hypothetical protein
MLGGMGRSVEPVRRILLWFNISEFPIYFTTSYRRNKRIAKKKVFSTISQLHDTTPLFEGGF